MLLPLVAQAAADVAAAASPEHAVHAVLTSIGRLPGVRVALLDPEPAAETGQAHEQTLDCPVAWDQHVHRVVTHGEPAIARPPVRWALESLISLLSTAVRAAGTAPERSQRPAAGDVVVSTSPTAAQAEALLAEGFHRGLDAPHIGVVLLDEHQHIVVVNETLARMFDLDVPPGRRAGGPPCAGDEQCPRLVIEPGSMLATMTEGLADREPVIGAEIRLADGRIIERHVVPTVAGGSPAGHLLLVRDVTGRTPTEHSLEERNLALAELSALKTQFVSSVSHELRTPLTSIISFSELLSEAETENLTGEQREYLEIIDRNAHRLHRLVGDLLLLAKLETRALPMDEADVDVATVVGSAVSHQHHPAETGGITLTWKVPPGPPLTGDAGRLRQALDHLLGNAVKFTPAGGMVSVTGEWDAEGWTVRIVDSGIGISEEDRERLFTPFFRSFRARERNIAGTGLGLVISRALVNAHGGRLTLESAEPAGTVVTLRLPFDRTAAEPRPAVADQYGVGDPVQRDGPGRRGDVEEAR